MKRKLHSIFTVIFISLSTLTAPGLYAQEESAEVAAKDVSPQEIFPQEVPAADISETEIPVSNQLEEKIPDEELSSDALAAEALVQANFPAPDNTEVIHPEGITIDFPQKKIIGLTTEEILARPEVEKFRRQYLSPKWSALLHSYLENAMEYRLYVRKAVQDNEVPEILEYLPVVESNYKTNAKSRSGAIGMWQFMANSVWPFLTLNDYVDERLDPWKSTDAALKKLQDNYKQFDDWFLAIAAYNCGMGALNRTIKKAKASAPEDTKIDFWYLLDHNLLPSQTANYVPKLIAIADLAINSRYYGIDLPSHEEEFEILENEKNGNFDYVTVNKAYSLSQLAQEMRMETSTIKRLNPSYVMGMTHPAKKSEIRLPLGMKQSALDALEKIEPIEFPIKYTVSAGDSLWSISRRYKVTVQAICDLNNIEENAILKIGKILYIPAK